MREWLDRNDRRLAHFETEANGDIITVKVQLDSDDSAQLFRQAFRGSTTPIAEPASDKVAQEPALSLKRRRVRREPKGLGEASRPANKRSGFADAASALIVFGTALFFVFAG
jgi:hypothetical protein